MRLAPLVLSVASLALAAGCSLPASVAPTGLASATSSSPVRFEVTGGKAGAQDTDADLPWSAEVPADGYAVSSLVAQNAGSGEIKCRITRDGKVIAEQTSRGQYAVVTCSG